MNIKSKTSRGKETREKINQATLSIIRRDGMRGVRHRAVANEAGVPLGATTYHFKDIEDLIVSAFIQWHAQESFGSNPYVTQVEDFVEREARSMLDTVEGRVSVARELYQLTVAYEIDQIEEHWDSRLVELAFYHESLHSEKLRQEVVRYWQRELDDLIASFRVLRSPDPESDARISQSIFHQLEREAMIKGKDYDRAVLKATLHRHVCYYMGVDFTP